MVRDTAATRLTLGALLVGAFALAAVDTELGILKTGKEADVHLVARGLPGDAETLMAAKRYRTAEHRMFHRDATQSGFQIAVPNGVL